MNLIPKRLIVVTLIGMLLVSGAFANAMRIQDTPLPATKPVIQGTLNNSPLDGVPGSYCWPTTDSSPQCDVVDDPQPTSGGTLANGDSVVFTINPAAPAPQQLSATLLDDKNADGDATKVDLTTTGGIFTPASLPDGAHRVEVDAIYAGDVQGNQPFVSEVFLLNVTGGAAATAAATAPAVEATSQEVAPTIEGTVLPSSTAEAPTEVPATQGAPTEVAATEVATAQVAATEGAVTEVPAATVEATSVEATAVPATAVLGTAVPGTAVPATAEAPTIVAPADTATPTPTVVAPIIDTSNIPGITAYPLAAIVGGRSYDPIAVNICVTGSQSETVCVNRPTDTGTQKIVSVTGSVAQFNFKGPHPSAITVTQYSSDGSTLIGKQSLLPDNLVLYTLPAKTGSFVLNVEVTYPTGKANYYFRFNIN